MDNSIRNLKTDLDNNRVPQNEDDKFGEVMEVFSLFQRYESVRLISRICLGLLQRSKGTVRSDAGNVKENGKIVQRLSRILFI